MNGSSIVFWAAFGGAAAAGIVTLFAMLAAEWYRWYLDRPLVRVSASLGFYVGADPPDHTLYLFLEAKNPHTKPVTLSAFGLSFKRKEWGSEWVPPRRCYPFPYKLDGGESLTQWTPVQGLLASLEKQGRAPSDLKWVWFKSSSGKLFRNKIEGKVIQSLEEKLSKPPSE
jgi:hypothetical protein